MKARCAMGRVLVIDDSEEFREVVADLLRDAGHVVCTAASPDEARIVWSKNPCDVVLCDLVMPMNHQDEDLVDDSESVMVGVHAIHQFSREFPGTPIVAVSGKLTGEPLKAVDKFGAFATLSKPFSREELLSIVDHALSVSEAPAN